jgi:hypothetical protein
MLDYKVPFLKGLRANVNLGGDFQSGQGTDIASDSTGFAYATGKLAAMLHVPGTVCCSTEDFAMVIKANQETTCWMRT